MLHEVLEEEATASEPIPDAMLPRVVEFIQEFPQYLETVVHCARKTEVALWSYLFSAVGNPRDLFKECLNTGRLQTAASYLIILQNLEHPSVSKQHATILLDKALELCRWEISKDLVRFLRCISEGELDSPPRSPTYRPMHSPPHPSVSSVDGEDMAFSFTGNPQTRGSKPTTRGTLSRGGSIDKTHRPQPLDKTSKTGSSSGKTGYHDNLSRTKSGSVSSTDSKSQTCDVESVENYFIDTILNRHARLLLSSNRLRDLGRFAANVEFQLVPWLIKERNRAARVEGYVETLLAVYRKFDLQLPTITQQPIKVLVPQSPKPWSRMDRLASSSSTSTVLSKQDYEENGDIEEGQDIVEIAHLHPPKMEDVDRLSGTYSETSSLAYSTDDDYLWGGQDIGFIDINGIKEQLAFSGCQQALTEIRFLMEIFMEALCYDWWFLLALVLRDSNAVTQCINKVVTLQDVTPELLRRLNEGRNAIEAWAEKECVGYNLFLNLLKPQFQSIVDSFTAAKEQAAERKDSGPHSPTEPARRTPKSSISEDDKIIEETKEIEEEEIENVDDSNECVLS